MSHFLIAMLKVIMLSIYVIVLSVVMLSVVMLNVIMVNVVVTDGIHHYTLLVVLPTMPVSMLDVVH